MKELLNNILFYIDLYKRLNSPYKDQTQAKLDTIKAILK
jgi:hypothetical protein